MNCEQDRYYEITRNGKVEMAICIHAHWTASTFEFLDGDHEQIVITQDLLDAGLYKFTYAQSLNTLMT